MSRLRGIATAEENNSLRELASRYGVRTARQLVTTYDDQHKYTYFGHMIERTGSDITIKSQSGESTNIKIGDTKLTPDQRDKALEKIWDGIKEYFQKHWGDIKSGNIKAADIGGTVYGITASVIVITLAPFTTIGPLAKIVTLPFIEAAAQKGRFWGASVDEVVKFIKGESDLNRRQMAGVLGTVIFVASYLPTPGALIPLGGVDAWNLTVSVGKVVGGTVAEGVEEIVSAVGDVVEGAGDEVVSFFKKLF